MSLDSGRARALIEGDIVARWEKVGRAVHDEQVQLCPVATGALQRSIDWALDNDGEFVELRWWAGGAELVAATGRDYSRYVEYGTSNPNYPVQPFFRPPLADLDRRLRGDAS